MSKKECGSLLLVVVLAAPFVLLNGQVRTLEVAPSAITGTTVSNTYTAVQPSSTINPMTCNYQKCPNGCAYTPAGIACVEQVHAYTCSIGWAVDTNGNCVQIATSTPSSTSITLNGYYHYGYIPSGEQVFWLVSDSGQKCRLIFVGGLGSPNLPNGSPLPDGSHITVTGTLTTPSASTGYDADIAVSSSGGICYLSSSSGEISPCLHGTCDPSRGIYCPTTAQTATATSRILDALARFWNWLCCLFGYCS